MIVKKKKNENIILFTIYIKKSIFKIKLYVFTYFLKNVNVFFVLNFFVSAYIVFIDV